MVQPREQHSSLWIPASPSAGLADLLDGAKSLQFDVGKGTADADDSDKDNAPLEPIYIESPAIKSPLVLDWWSDRSIKPWAGSMKERLILRAMLGAIDPMDGDPLNYAKPVSDPSPPVVAGKRSKQTRKREPFYFDCRRGSNAHPLDSGFSPDTHHLESFCFPTVEALCFIGLQRARPALANVPNRLRYTAWTESVPVNAIGPGVCGIVGCPAHSTSSTISFEPTRETTRVFPAQLVKGARMSEPMFSQFSDLLQPDGPVAIIITQALVPVNEDDQIIFPPTYPMTSFKVRVHTIRDGDYRVSVELPPDSKRDKNEKNSDQRPGYNLDRFPNGTTPARSTARSRRRIG